jgi:ABC-2 type transport system permease protein
MNAPRPPQPRQFGSLNGRGLWTLFRRGIGRFLKEAIETLGGPIVSGAMFLGVFVIAYQPGSEVSGGLSPVTFTAPGVIAFALAMAAFEFGAVPVIYDKLEGMIGDIVSAPLSAGEMMAGYVLSAAAIGLLVGAAVFLVLAPFSGLDFAMPQLSLLFAVLGALLFGLLGTLTGLWAEKWEAYAAAQTFMVLPLAFLSCAFFPLDTLPEAAQTAVRFNPVFYLIDGFRQGLVGRGESNPLLGLGYLAAADLLLALLCARLFRIGYKIRA